MTPEQRKNHLKLQSIALKSTTEGDTLDLCPKPTEFTSPQLSSHSNSRMQISTSTLAVDVSIAATLVNIPITCLEGIWV